MKGVQFLADAMIRFFFSPLRPDQLWGPPIQRVSGVLTPAKAAGAWSWLLTST